MSKKKKIWFAILACAPLLISIPLCLSLVTLIPDPEAVTSSQEPVSLFVENIFVMTLFFALWIIFLILAFIYYVSDVLKNPKFKGDKKTHKWFWVFLILLMNSIGMLAYFFKEIKNRKTEDSTGTL